MLNVQYNVLALTKTNSLVVCFIFHTDVVCHLLGAAISFSFFFINQIIFSYNCTYVLFYTAAVFFVFLSAFGFQKDADL